MSAAAVTRSDDLSSFAKKRPQSAVGYGVGEKRSYSHGYTNENAYPDVGVQGSDNEFGIQKDERCDQNDEVNVVINDDSAADDDNEDSQGLHLGFNTAEYGDLNLDISPEEYTKWNSNRYRIDQKRQYTQISAEGVPGPHSIGIQPHSPTPGKSPSGRARSPSGHFMNSPIRSPKTVKKIKLWEGKKDTYTLQMECTGLGDLIVYYEKILDQEMQKQKATGNKQATVNERTLLAESNNANANLPAGKRVDHARKIERRFTGINNNVEAAYADDQGRIIPLLSLASQDIHKRENDGKPKTSLLSKPIDSYASSGADLDPVVVDLATLDLASNLSLRTGVPAANSIEGSSGVNVNFTRTASTMQFASPTNSPPKSPETVKRIHDKLDSLKDKKIEELSPTSAAAVAKAQAKRICKTDLSFYVGEIEKFKKRYVELRRQLRDPSSNPKSLRATQKELIQLESELKDLFDRKRKEEERLKQLEALYGSLMAGKLGAKVLLANESKRKFEKASKSPERKEHRQKVRFAIRKGKSMRKEKWNSYLEVDDQDYETEPTETEEDTNEDPGSRDPDGGDQNDSSSCYGEEEEEEDEVSELEEEEEEESYAVPIDIAVHSASEREKRNPKMPSEDQDEKGSNQNENQEIEKGDEYDANQPAEESQPSEKTSKKEKPTAETEGDGTIGAEAEGDEGDNAKDVDEEQRAEAEDDRGHVDEEAASHKGGRGSDKGDVENKKGGKKDGVSSFMPTKKKLKKHPSEVQSELSVTQNTTESSSSSAKGDKIAGEQGAVSSMPLKKNSTEKFQSSGGISGTKRKSTKRSKTSSERISSKIEGDKALDPGGVEKEFSSSSTSKDIQESLRKNSSAKSLSRQKSSGNKKSSRRVLQGVITGYVDNLTSAILEEELKGSLKGGLEGQGGQEGCLEGQFGNSSSDRNEFTTSSDWGSEGTDWEYGTITIGGTTLRVKPGMKLPKMQLDSKTGKLIPVADEPESLEIMKTRGVKTHDVPVTRQDTVSQDELKVYEDDSIATASFRTGFTKRRSSGELAQRGQPVSSEGLGDFRGSQGNLTESERYTVITPSSGEPSRMATVPNSNLGGTLENIGSSAEQSLMGTLVNSTEADYLEMLIRNCDIHSHLYGPLDGSKIEDKKRISEILEQMPEGKIVFPKRRTKMPEAKYSNLYGAKAMGGVRDDSAESGILGSSALSSANSQLGLSHRIFGDDLDGSLNGTIIADVRDLLPKPKPPADRSAKNAKKRLKKEKSDKTERTWRSGTPSPVSPKSPKSGDKRPPKEKPPITHDIKGNLLDEVSAGLVNSLFPAACSSPTSPAASAKELLLNPPEIIPKYDKETTNKWDRIKETYHDHITGDEFHSIAKDVPLGWSGFKLQKETKEERRLRKLKKKREKQALLSLEREISPEREKFARENAKNVMVDCNVRGKLKVTDDGKFVWNKGISPSGSPTMVHGPNHDSTGSNATIETRFQSRNGAMIDQITTPGGQFQEFHYPSHLIISEGIPVSPTGGQACVVTTNENNKKFRRQTKYDRDKLKLRTKKERAMGVDEEGNIIDFNALRYLNCPTEIAKAYISSLTLELYTRIMVDQILQEQIRIHRYETILYKVTPVYLKDFYITICNRVFVWENMKEVYLVALAFYYKVIKQDEENRIKRAIYIENEYRQRLKRLRRFKDIQEILGGYPNAGLNPFPRYDAWSSSYEVDFNKSSCLDLESTMDFKWLAGDKKGNRFQKFYFIELMGSHHWQIVNTVASQELRNQFFLNFQGTTGANRVILYERLHKLVNPWYLQSSSSSENYETNHNINGHIINNGNKNQNATSTMMTLLGVKDKKTKRYHMPLKPGASSPRRDSRDYAGKIGFKKMTPEIDRSFQRLYGFGSPIMILNAIAKYYSDLDEARKEEERRNAPKSWLETQKENQVSAKDVLKSLFGGPSSSNDGGAVDSIFGGVSSMFDPEEIAEAKETAIAIIADVNSLVVQRIVIDENAERQRLQDEIDAKQREEAECVRGRRDYLRELGLNDIDDEVDVDVGSQISSQYFDRSIGEGMHYFHAELIEIFPGAGPSRLSSKMNSRKITKDKIFRVESLKDEQSQIFGFFDEKNLYCDQQHNEKVNFEKEKEEEELFEVHEFPLPPFIEPIGLPFQLFGVEDLGISIFELAWVEIYDRENQKRELVRMRHQDIDILTEKEIKALEEAAELKKRGIDEKLEFAKILLGFVYQKVIDNFINLVPVVDHIIDECFNDMGLYIEDLDFTNREGELDERFDGNLYLGDMIGRSGAPDKRNVWSRKNLTEYDKKQHNSSAEYDTKEYDTKEGIEKKSVVKADLAIHQQLYRVEPYGVEPDNDPSMLKKDPPMLTKIESKESKLVAAERRWKLESLRNEATYWENERRYSIATTIANIYVDYLTNPTKRCNAEMIKLATEQADSIIMMQDEIRRLRKSNDSILLIDEGLISKPGSDYKSVYNTKRDGMKRIDDADILLDHNDPDIDEIDQFGSPLFKKHTFAWSSAIKIQSMYRGILGRRRYKEELFQNLRWKYNRIRQGKMSIRTNSPKLGYKLFKGKSPKKKKYEIENLSAIKIPGVQMIDQSVGDHQSMGDSHGGFDSSASVAVNAAVPVVQPVASSDARSPTNNAGSPTNNIEIADEEWPDEIIKTDQIGVSEKKGLAIDMIFPVNDDADETESGPAIIEFSLMYQMLRDAEDVLKEGNNSFDVAYSSEVHRPVDGSFRDDLGDHVVNNESWNKVDNKYGNKVDNKYGNRIALDVDENGDYGDSVDEKIPSYDRNWHVISTKDLHKEVIDSLKDFVESRSWIGKNGLTSLPASPRRGNFAKRFRAELSWDICSRYPWYNTISTAEAIPKLKIEEVYFPPALYTPLSESEIGSGESSTWSRCLDKHEQRLELMEMLHLLITDGLTDGLREEAESEHGGEEKFIYPDNVDWKKLCPEANPRNRPGMIRMSYFPGDQEQSDYNSVEAGSTILQKSNLEDGSDQSSSRKTGDTVISEFLKEYLEEFWAHRFGMVPYEGSREIFDENTRQRLKIDENGRPIIVPIEERNSDLVLLWLRLKKIERIFGIWDGKIRKESVVKVKSPGISSSRLSSSVGSSSPKTRERNFKPSKNSRFACIVDQVIVANQPKISDWKKVLFVGVPIDKVSEETLETFKIYSEHLLSFTDNGTQISKSIKARAERGIGSSFLSDMQSDSMMIAQQSEYFPEFDSMYLQSEENPAVAAVNTMLLHISTKRRFSFDQSSILTSPVRRSSKRTLSKRSRGSSKAFTNGKQEPDSSAHLLPPSEHEFQPDAEEAMRAEAEALRVKYEGPNGILNLHADIIERYLLDISDIHVLKRMFLIFKKLSVMPVYAQSGLSFAPGMMMLDETMDTIQSRRLEGVVSVEIPSTRSVVEKPIASPVVEAVQLERKSTTVNDSIMAANNTPDPIVTPVADPLVEGKRTEVDGRKSRKKIKGENIRGEMSNVNEMIVENFSRSGSQIAPRRKKIFYQFFIEFKKSIEELVIDSNDGFLPKEDTKMPVMDARSKKMKSRMVSPSLASPPQHHSSEQKKDRTNYYNQEKIREIVDQELDIEIARVENMFLIGVKKGDKIIAKNEERQRKLDFENAKLINIQEAISIEEDIIELRKGGHQEEERFLEHVIGEETGDIEEQFISFLEEEKIKHKRKLEKEKQAEQKRKIEEGKKEAEKEREKAIAENVVHKMKKKLRLRKEKEREARKEGEAQNESESRHAESRAGGENSTTSEEPISPEKRPDIKFDVSKITTGSHITPYRALAQNTTTAWVSNLTSEKERGSKARSKSNVSNASPLKSMKTTQNTTTKSMKMTTQSMGSMHGESSAATEFGFQDENMYTTETNINLEQTNPDWVKTNTTILSQLKADTSFQDDQQVPAESKSAMDLTIILTGALEKQQENLKVIETPVDDDRNIDGNSVDPDAHLTVHARIIKENARLLEESKQYMLSPEKQAQPVRRIQSVMKRDLKPSRLEQCLAGAETFSTPLKIFERSPFATPNLIPDSYHDMSDLARQKDDGRGTDLSKMKFDHNGLPVVEEGMMSVIDASAEFSESKVDDGGESGENDDDSRRDVSQGNSDGSQPVTAKEDPSKEKSKKEDPPENDESMDKSMDTIDKKSTDSKPSTPVGVDKNTVSNRDAPDGGKNIRNVSRGGLNALISAADEFLTPDLDDSNACDRSNRIIFDNSNRDGISNGFNSNYSNYYNFSRDYGRGNYTPTGKGYFDQKFQHLQSPSSMSQASRIIRWDKKWSSNSGGYANAGDRGGDYRIPNYGSTQDYNKVGRGPFDASPTSTSRYIPSIIGGTVLSKLDPSYGAAYDKTNQNIGLRKEGIKKSKFEELMG